MTISTLSAMEMVYAGLSDGTLHLYFVNVSNNYLYQMIMRRGMGQPDPYREQDRQQALRQSKMPMGPFASPIGMANR